MVKEGLKLGRKRKIRRYKPCSFILKNEFATMDDKKLYLLDAYALIYRAYHAMKDVTIRTSSGLNTSTILGFCNTLDEILRKENPTHIAICFDPHGPTFRHELFDQYKAQREAQPEDITIAVPIIKEIVGAYNIHTFEVPGYEADDVIGTIATMASGEGFTTYMITPDKDYGQLVRDNVFMLRPPRFGQGFELCGPAEVCKKFDIDNPRQVIDFLALAGDSSDNVPGCPGVGKITASKLIKEYGCVSKMLEHAEIKGKLGERLTTNADNIRLSEVLVTIKCDVPVEVDFDALKRVPEDVARLREIFTRLEFRTLLSRLKGGDAVPSAPTKNVSTQAATNAPASLFDFIDGEAEQPAAEVRNAEQNDYKIVTSAQDIETLVKDAMVAEYVGMSLYAPGAEAMTATLCGVAVSVAEGVARYVTIPNDTESRKQLFAQMRPLFTAEKTVLVSHDIKRDMVLLRCEGIDLSANYFDTSLAHYVLQPEMRHRLADIAMSVLNYEMVDYTEPSSSRKPYPKLPDEEVVVRVCEQADVVRRLQAPLKGLLETNKLLTLAATVEMPLARVLADMEFTGVRIDSDELNKLSAQLTERLHNIEEEVYTLAGARFNIASPSQVGEVLFGQMKLDPKAKRTKTGAYSTTEEILEKYRSAHPIVDLILRARSLRKLLTTYVNALPELVNPRTGRIHTTYNQTVTATGRISSANPNLQNIPIRTDDGREVRRAFIADEGCKVLSADYSQIELRLLAALSHDPDLIDAFRRGLDIHRATAAKIYHVPFEEVTDDQRRKAKTANFGTVYGISAFGLSERLAISRAEAKELIEGYFATYPHIKEYIAESIAGAREMGYVTTVMGRVRFLPDINSRNATVRSYAERNAVNAPLQGSAADIIKLAMIRIYNEMNRRGMRSRMVMQVHDELIFNVVPEEQAELQELVEQLMMGAFEGDVTLEVSSGVGTNWLEAH